MATILAVAASARRKGNSDTLLEKALEPAREAGHEIQTVIPRQLSITPCRSCNACWETGQCVVNDEMQQLYEDFCTADRVAIASPTYFTSLPGHFKVMIDRFQCFWVRTYRLKKPPQPRRTGMFLSIAAMDKERYYRCCRTTVRTWLSTLNIECTVERFYSGLDAKDDIQEREDYMEDARDAGRQFITSSPCA